MTAAPFRELFVELPRALFESLQAIGEAAVQRARANAGGPKSPHSSFDWLNKAARVLAYHYGWFEVIRIEREMLDHYSTLVVRLDCMHAQRYRFDELAMLLAANQADVANLVCNIIETTEQNCYCVQRPTETP